MKRQVMSTRNIINLIKSYAEGKNYVEIGVFKGYVLAEVAEVAKSAVGIDDFSQFDELGENRADTIRRIEGKAKLIEGDCYAPNVLKQVRQPDVIFYDAGHTYEDTKKAIECYGKKLKKGGIMIFDDWNHEPTRLAALDNMTDFKLIFEQFSPKNADSEWWNGIAVYEKL